MSTFLAVDQYKGRKNIVDGENNRKLGEFGYLRDTEFLNGQMERVRSAMLTKCRIVKYEGVTTLSASQSVVFSANKYGTHVTNVAADGSQIDGVVDPFLTKTIVPGDTFLLFVEGPANVICSAAVAGPYIIAAGTGKVKTAVIGTAGRSARLLEDGTGKADTELLRVYLQCDSSH